MFGDPRDTQSVEYRAQRIIVLCMLALVQHRTRLQPALSAPPDTQNSSDTNDVVSTLVEMLLILSGEDSPILTHDIMTSSKQCGSNLSMYTVHVR